MAVVEGVEEFTESVSRRLTLTSADAVALQALGRRLASSASWWGSSDEDDDPRERSVISVRPAGGDQWDVRVADAVGAIAAGSAQLLVQPKVPAPHLLYLFSKA